MGTLIFKKIDMDYVKFLYDNFDKRVQYNPNMSIQYNANRPYIGAVIDVNGITYFAPLEHPRPEHKQIKANKNIIKIQNGKYGLIGLNNMLPVPAEALIDIDIKADKNSKILQAQFIFCSDNALYIKEKAHEVYQARINPNKFVEKVYCDFKKLERGMEQYCMLKKYAVPPLTAKITIAERIEKAKQKI